MTAKELGELMSNQKQEIKITINAFWNWFQNIEKNLRDNIANDIIEQIDEKVLELGPFSWEIGPGLTEKYSFVISPNGDKELLNQTKEIISSAPLIDGWEFHSTKPAKIWNYEFSFYDEDNKEIYVNAQKWEYVLLKYPDQTYDIYLKGPDYLYNEKDIQAASEILLIGVLGEKDFIDYISNIEVVKEFDSNLVGKETNIKLLKKHLTELNNLR